MRAVVCVLVAVLVITACQAMTTEANPTTGAIFTTTANGATVNGNIYTNKNDVYLNGGPQSGCSQAGLQDGIYYFQVTDPSGTVLLSEDKIECRTVVVANGYFQGGGGSCLTAGPNGGSCCHQQVLYNPAAGCTGQRQTQLMPYSDTTNPGGEYKAWVTRVVDFDWDNYQ